MFGVWSMVYGVIGLALFCLAVKGYSGKRISCVVRNTGDALLFTFLRMIFCMLIGLVLIFAEGSVGFLRMDGTMFWICLLSGAANAALLVGWMLAVRKNSMVSVDVSTTLGSLLPAVLCAGLFSEALSIPKMFGFAIIIVATLILAGKNQDKKSRSAVGALLLLFAAISDGMCGFSQQLYKQYYTEAGSMTRDVLYPKTVYHFYTYVFSALILLLVLGAYWMFGGEKKRQSCERESVFGAVSPRVVLHIFGMAVCLFAANYFQTVATGDYGMSSQMLYPIIKGGCLITSGLTAMLFFGEKLTVRRTCGLLTALAGIVCMSIV